MMMVQKIKQQSYNEDVMGKFLTNNYLPPWKVLSQYTGGENFIVSKTFHKAAVSFLSEHFFLMKI